MAFTQGLFNAYSLGLLALLFAGFAFLLASHPPNLPKRILAIFLILSACFEILNVVRLPRDLVDNFVWPTLVFSAEMASVSFFAVYPRRAGLRSWHGLLLVTATVVFFSAFVLRVFASSLVVTPDRAGHTLLGFVVGADGSGPVRPLLESLMVASAFVRAWNLPATERRGVAMVSIAVFGAGLGAMGTYVVYWGALAIGATPPFVPLTIFLHVPGDPYSLLFVAHVLGRIVVPFAILVAAIVRFGSGVPYLLVGLQAIAALPGVAGGAIAFTDTPYLLLAILPAYAGMRYGALGIRDTPSWGIALLSIATGLGCVFIVESFVFDVTSDPLALSLGIAVGLVVGVVAAFAVVPRLRLILATTLTTGPTAIDSFVEARVGGQVFSRYRILRLLGEGGQGSAYLARDEALGRDVVLKLSPVTGPDALREARALAALDHPNVVRVLDVVQTSRETVMVLEYVEGGTLRGRLRAGPVREDEATRIMGDLLSGLAAAHASGVVHRDVKPENILLTKEGQAKLADFGVARETDAAATMRAGPVGTLAYMSPEQVRGENADAKSDVYACGAILAELLAGRPVIDGRGLDDFSFRAKILRGAAQAAVEGKGVADIARHALAVDPDARYPDARAMRVALMKAAAAPTQT